LLFFIIASLYKFCHNFFSITLLLDFCHSFFSITLLAEFCHLLFNNFAGWLQPSVLFNNFAGWLLSSVLFNDFAGWLQPSFLFYNFIGWLLSSALFMKTVMNRYCCILTNLFFEYLHVSFSRTLSFSYPLIVIDNFHYSFFSKTLLHNFFHTFFKNFVLWLRHSIFSRTFLDVFCIRSFQELCRADFCNLFFSITLLGLILLSVLFRNFDEWLPFYFLSKLCLMNSCMCLFLKIIDICHPSHDFSHLPFLILSYLLTF
jgi:hypothetical protein